MIVCALLVVGLAAGEAAVRPTEGGVQPYRDSAAAGAFGVVAGRSVAEGLKPGALDRPLADVAVTLLPRSDRLLRRLDDIRRDVRADMDAFRASARAVVTARRAWERALADDGAGDLVRYTRVGPDGTFDLERVPAGEWLLVAERAVFVSKPEPRARERESQLFLPRSRLLGYWIVTFWLLELEVRGGELTRVRLSERNAWLTAIEERREPAE